MPARHTDPYLRRSPCSPPQIPVQGITDGNRQEGLGFARNLDPEFMDPESLEHDLAFNASAILPEPSRVVEGGIKPRAAAGAIFARSKTISGPG